MKEAIGQGRAAVFAAGLYKVIPSFSAWFYSWNQPNLNA